MAVRKGRRPLMWNRFKKYVWHPCPPLVSSLSSIPDKCYLELQSFSVTLICSTAHHAIWSPCPQCCSAAFHLPDPEFLEHFPYQLPCTLLSLLTRPHPKASFSNSLNSYISRTWVGIILPLTCKHIFFPFFLCFPFFLSQVHASGTRRDQLFFLSIFISSLLVQNWLSHFVNMLKSSHLLNKNTCSHLCHSSWVLSSAILSPIEKPSLNCIPQLSLIFILTFIFRNTGSVRMQ